jgi:hypothetical protein
LQATDAFAAGLRLLPAGAAVADGMALPVSRSIETALLASSPPPAAMGWVHFSQTRGWRARGYFIGRKLVPTPTLMRAWSPLARRSRLGLALAYLWRPAWVLLHAGPGLIARRRVARRLQRSRGMD